MACSGCRKKAKINGIQRSFSAKNKTNIQANDFKPMYYIGNSGTLKSTVKQLHYGHRNNGELMYVHVKDLSVNPQLFSKVKPSE